MTQLVLPSVAPSEAPKSPRWTVPSFTPTPGRYPLGTEAVAFVQLDELASGLPVLSQHPRYWSIYTYIIKSFWDRKISPQTNTALGRFLKPHEVVFACASLLCSRHPELPGIIGRNTFVPLLRDKPAHIDLNQAYLKQGLGGYGQVYRGAMSDLGIIVRAEQMDKVKLDSPFGDIGASLASAFGNAIADTTYAKKYAGQTEGSIPVAVVQELAEASCFCRLAAFPAERDILIDILLGRVQDPYPTHLDRARTIGVFLHLADSTDGDWVDQERFRNLLYRGQDGSLKWRPSEKVEPAWRRWWLVRHREIVVGCMNALFVHFVRWGLTNGGALRPLRTSDYWTLLDELPVRESLQLKADTLGSLALQEVIGLADAVVEEEGWPITPKSSPLHEDELLVRTDRGLAQDAPTLCALALVVALRRLRAFESSQGHHSVTETRMIAEGGIDRVGTRHLAEWLAGRGKRGLTVAAVLRDLVQTYVIRQHMRIARGKLPEDTFRLHQDGGGLCFVDQGDGQGLNQISIRFDAVASALAELGLIEAPFSVAKHASTSTGQQVLNA